MFSKHFTSFQLFGGLGNQLFILAAGRYLAEKCAHEVSYNTWYLENFGENHGLSLESRGFADHFEHKPPVSGKSGRPFFERLGLTKRLHVPRYGFGWDPELIRVSQGTQVKGYFQSWRYAGALDRRISREAVLFRNATSSWYRDETARALEERPLMVHVRRGDYRGLGSKFGLVGQDYYSKAIRLARSLGMANDIWVISDEPDVAIDVLGVMNSTPRFIKPPPGTDAGESLALLAHAGANIISNSTFSWWGAFLNPAPEFVVAPDPWFRDLASPAQLLPANWLTAQHQFVGR